VILALAALGTLAAAHGLYQSLVEFPRLTATAADLPEAVRARIASGRAIAAFGLPGALAGLLGITIPLTLMEIIRPMTSRLARGAGIACLALQAAALLAARSAAALGSLAIAAALTWWISRPAGRSRWRGAAALAGAGVIVAALLLAARLSGAGAADEGSGPFSLRAGNWLVAARMLGDHPIFGAGLGCYGVLFPQYRQWGMNESRFAHNSYLQLFAEGGLLLGLLGAACAVMAARALLRRARAGGEPALLAAAGLGCLLHNLFDFTFYLPSIALALAAVAGLSSRDGAEARHVARGTRAVMMAAALILAAVALWIARGDAARAAVLEEPGSDRIVELARLAVEADPIDPESRALLSGALLESALEASNPEPLEEALRHAQRACDLDRFTPHHWSQLGRVRLATQDPVGAWLALARAAELYPTHIPYREERDAVAQALGGTRAPGGTAP
jgi:hypothetical protein